MFALSERDLEKRILGVADGPAAFNAELTARGGNVVSVDPLYQFSQGQIQQRVEAVAPMILTQVRENLDDFVWDMIRSPEHLLEIRMDSMTRFVADFEAGKRQGRYIQAELPSLPFSAGTFELAVCSHFLLLYGEVLDFSFHLSAVLELMRVVKELRIFPVLELGNASSRHLNKLRAHLESSTYTTELVQTGYEFQRGGHQMLVIRVSR